jgi:hypothetical protein
MMILVRVMVFNATFNNISLLSWRSVFLVEETGEDLRSVADKLYHIMLYRVLKLRNSIYNQKSTSLQNIMYNLHSLLNNYITSVFHWNVTIWLVMKWSHDFKRDVLHPNKTQTRTYTCLHDDVRCKQSMA